MGAYGTTARLAVLPQGPAVLPLRRAWRSPAEIPAASTTTPSCCWISMNLSFPLLDQEGGDVFPNRTCGECGGAVRSALGSSVIWITTRTTPSTPFS